MSSIESPREPLQAKPYSCPRHPRESEEKTVKPLRNLVVCIDGTSNEFGQNNTNVVKLFAKIDLKSTHPSQFGYYSSGIGTRPKKMSVIESMSRAVSDTFDMAVAWNVEEIVKDAYSWLAQRYRDGDRIYLFGFSRGAYQVRVLAAMIYEVGLIRTSTDKQIGMAYDHYDAIDVKKPKTRQNAREFKNTFSWNAKVHFVGVWDTVSSVGLIRGDVFLSGSSSMEHACYFRHALALDERRVKFLPEYFHEMNSLTQEGKYPHKPLFATTSERRASSAGDSGIHSSEGREGQEGGDERIKEVWFAGSHSDVGGTNKPGKTYQAGNTSLLWMRREAAEKGLVLESTDIVWVPDDIDFGTSDSMKGVWRAVEHMPITHQVSYSGFGENSRRRHLRQPRRIIPGQKVHASILYANAYAPQAWLGKGYDIPIVHADLDMKSNDPFWETELFDDSAAQELVNNLNGDQGVAPVYLDWLLFILRFKEGKQCIRNVDGWREKFTDLIDKSERAPLVRLIAIVAYYEASYDANADSNSAAQVDIKRKDEIFDRAKKDLLGILDTHKHRDGPRVAALLRPLTKHLELRKNLLTNDVLDKLMNLLDMMLGQTEGYFGQAMDGLSCLLQHEDTRGIIIEKLGGRYSNSKATRLSRILRVKDTHLLTAALRMVKTLAEIDDDDARAACNAVKPRLRRLARSSAGLVGALAVETLLILLVKQDPNRLQLDPSELQLNPNQNIRGALIGSEKHTLFSICKAVLGIGQQSRLNIYDKRVRTNLARVFTRFTRFTTKQSTPADGRGLGRDLEEGILRTLFGLDEEQLDKLQKRFIGALKNAAEDGSARERTAATFILLNLCETPIIRTYLLEIKLLDVLIKQLRRKRTALLAAYALTTLLQYIDMKKPIVDDKLFPRNIVNMLRRGYFDDAVKDVEGFQIFAEMMRHEDLREKIKKYNIIKVLKSKLKKGKPKEIRTSLICLDIFQSFDPNYRWTDKLLKKGLECLRSEAWKTQKAGVTILASLAQTEHGVAAIDPKVEEIVKMLLPESHVPIQQPSESGSGGSQGGSLRSSSWMSVARGKVQGLLRKPGPGSANSGDAPAGPPSRMLGPACALRTLAQDEKLRERVRKKGVYDELKRLHLAGALVGAADTRPWDIYTPNRADVTKMLDKMIKAIDGELSEDGLMSIGDMVLPHIAHWDRFFEMFRVWAAWGVTGFLGLSILPVFLLASVSTGCSVWVWKGVKRVVSRLADAWTLDDLQNLEGEDA